MTKIKIDTWYTNQSIGSRGYCEWVADSQSKWGFCFAVLGFKLANIHDNVQTWKNCNYWWIYEVKKSVLRLLRLALRKIVYENKRELAWWLPYLLRWKQNTHWKVWLLKLVDIWFRSGGDRSPVNCDGNICVPFSMGRKRKEKQVYCSLLFLHYYCTERLVVLCFILCTVLFTC